ncbi:MAG: lasso peptide biosynthesis B2 protein [Longimicrobiales bacterium]
MRVLTRLAKIPSGDIRLVSEAAILLAAAGLLIRLRTFARLARKLGAHMSETPRQVDRSEIARARRIRWAVSAAAKRLPWKPVCLPQAVAATWMLRRRGIHSTLYLGVDRATGFDAHAWVRVGRVIVTGAPDHRRFSVVSSFA